MSPHSHAIQNILIHINLLTYNLLPPLLLAQAPTASTPACATSASCAGVPVLTPIAPTTFPSTSNGTPPPINVNLPPLLL